MQKNYAINKTEIDQALVRLTMDIYSDQWLSDFTAGIEFANIMYLLTDASVPDQDPAMMALFEMPAGPEVYAAELIASFFKEISYLNRFDGIGDCAVDTKESVKLVIKVLEDMMAGHEAKALADAIAASNSMRESLELCKTEAGSDVAQLATWMYNTMRTHEILVETVSASALEHSQEMYSQVEDVWDVFFKFDQPGKTGAAVANVAFWSLGPANPDVSL